MGTKVSHCSLQIQQARLPKRAPKKWTMYHYDVKFAPELEWVERMREFLKTHIAEMKQESSYIFDRTALYMMVNIKIDKIGKIR